jgi:predicted dithiol-disulfide oxidoreductase (DUF899 family)
MEAVAVARRALPPGGAVPEDYLFAAAGPDGTPIQVRLAELFALGKDSLVIYNFMFPRGYKGPRPGSASGDTALLPLEEGPCPSCTALLDQLDGAAGHVSQRLNFAVVAKTSLARLLTFSNERGWRHLSLLSSAGNTYNRDYFGEDEEGWQTPMLNVFHRDGEMIHHFWGAELAYSPSRPGSRPPERRHPRAAVESVRPDAGGPADGLGRATELPVTRCPGMSGNVAPSAEYLLLAAAAIAAPEPAQISWFCPLYGCQPGWSAYRNPGPISMRQFFGGRRWI